MNDRPTFLLCRGCDGLIGDCGGHSPGCPVTKVSISPTMRRILVAYAITLGMIALALYLLWSNGNPT